MELLLNDETCRIVHEPGDNGRAIVSFAGIGYALGGIQVEEFRKSLDGASFDIYYVIDKERRWYNGCYDAVVATINRSLAARRVEATVTLGNSMGGFGAVLFASALNRCRRAIAFSPQSSVSPAVVPFEDRWREWTRHIAHWLVPDAIPQMKAEIEYLLFFGAADPRDQRHADRFAAGAGQTLLCRIDDSGHGVAAEIKRRGLLIPLLDALLSPAPIERQHLSTLLGPIRHATLGRR
jgi:pimeloyl-ACP methyl ester carboxylesterase